MHTCFDPVIVFGIEEIKKNHICEDWIHENYPDLYIYGKYVIRGYCSEECVYGIVVDYDLNGDNEKPKDEMLDKFIEDYKKYHSIEEEITPKFHLCISGDVQYEEYDSYTFE